MFIHQCCHFASKQIKHLQFDIASSRYREADHRTLTPDNRIRVVLFECERWLEFGIWNLRQRVDFVLDADVDLLERRTR